MPPAQHEHIVDVQKMCVYSLKRARVCGSVCKYSSISHEFPLGLILRRSVVKESGSYS